MTRRADRNDCTICNVVGPCVHTPYQRAIARLMGQAKDDVVIELAYLIGSIPERLSMPEKERAKALWRIVEALHIRATELCGNGLDYEHLCRFAQIALVRVDRARWLEDELF